MVTITTPALGQRQAGAALSDQCLHCGLDAVGGADHICCADPSPPKASDVVPKTSATDTIVVCRAARICSDIPLMTVSGSQNEIYLIAQPPQASRFRCSMTLRANKSADAGFWPVKKGGSQITCSASGAAAL